MKRLLMVTLLLLIVSAFISCNSYDVEGKPEVASNPAKKVFAYFPWEGNDNQKPDDKEISDDSETPDDEETGDDLEVQDDAETSDEQESPDEEESDDDTANPVLVSLRSAISDTITQEFEIYNRGVTGELKIRKINFLSPNEKLIGGDELVDENYKKLFGIQIQKSVKGIVVEEWNSMRHTFDNMTASEGENIASLCPLDAKSVDRKCKDSFDKSKHNTHFKILLSYNKAAAEVLKNNPPDPELYKLDGDFWIEICTNDPGKDKSLTCGDNSTSFKIQVTRQPNKPPKPIIKVVFDYTTGGEMSYRNIKDKVSMNLRNTCVSDPDQPTQCLKDWKERYYIKYKWEMKESPTPLIPDSQLRLPGSSGFAGQWLPDTSKDDPKRAEFTGLMITPRRYLEKNPVNGGEINENDCKSCGQEPKNIDDEFYFLDLSNYLICRQKYCEKYATRYYKINIQAETVDKETDLVSDTADVTVVPKIIPQARVVAQLTWKQGLKTKTELTAIKDGVAIDLDIHMIKRNSLEAKDLEPFGYTGTLGVLGTNERPNDIDSGLISEPDYWRYFLHDDCSFSDKGVTDGTIEETIKWNASLDIDNVWGGNNFENPETIGLGPIEDKKGKVGDDGKETGDGVPDNPIMDDQYLIVVGYVNCTSKYADGKDRCKPDYTGEDSAYEVDARVDILVDGVDAPREERKKDGELIRPADNYQLTTKNFKIKHSDWKVIAVVKWDGSLPGPETNPNYPGDGLVSDIAMTDDGIDINPSGYKTCNFPYTDAVMVPVWVEDDYYNFVHAKRDPNDETSEPIGECK